ncbi:Smr/MutS family protein [Mesonia aestuariivivens]|uniref:DNA mismatch repair protein MutS n=1 Tax=Mesonia aestuariivivens TaxID=2796128 RepID=A0ABS6W0H9_9FLAO|nr:Smr/MutS family protein [Mesonia aestuariivivens]MBW2961353.1 DNA mismatch repair protein MutS [Mesonia aestuariivivens]
MNNNFKVNDRVEVLDEPIIGRVTGFNDTLVVIETIDGFLLEFSPEELVQSFEDEIDIVVKYDDVKAALQEDKSLKSKKRTSVKRKKVIPPMEVDLHIHHLVNSTKSLSNFEMLNIQLDTARRQLEFAINKRIQRIVFIHGVGQGVLKAELETLFSRYVNVKFYEADYKEYGLGATEVYVFQSVC